LIDARGHETRVRTSVLERTQRVPRTVDEVFAFFADPWNLATITPPWLHFRIEAAPPELERGSLIRYRLRVKGVPVRWLTEIIDWRPPQSFVDVQLAGPYRVWEHTHRLTPLSEEAEIYDHVRYRVPGGPLDPLVDRLVRPMLDEVFDFRAQRIADLFGRSPRLPFAP